MNKFVENNATWLSFYDMSVERTKLQELIQFLQIDNTKRLLILDVGCGNGRSVTWIRSLFPRSQITAIDIDEDSINYANEHCSYNSVSYLCIDAFKYFKLSRNAQFDIVFFSWSLFDMVSTYDQCNKEEKLVELIELAKESLHCNGHIIITQPTKGGNFEKLLSLFMPGSDLDYFLTHYVLIKKNFHGPDTPFPNRFATNTIWSNFICDHEQLYNGIESVLMLETGQQLNRSTFNTLINKFCSKYCVKSDGLYKLSDCVSIYYF